MTVTSDAPEPALSVRQVLALERVLAGVPEVVAGASHLDRPVRWVHVAEAADVGVMLSGGRDGAHHRPAARRGRGVRGQRLLGTSYFVDPEARFVGEVASDKEPELVVRDPALAKLREVRDRWQFYRDRAPGAYGPLTAP